MGIAPYLHRLGVSSTDFPKWNRDKLINELKFLSDLLFNVPGVDSILARRNTGWDLYAYFFNHYNDAIWDKNFPMKMKGSPHASEFLYTKDVSFFSEFEFNDEERVVADVFRQSFIEFVKIGVCFLLAQNAKVWIRHDAVDADSGFGEKNEGGAMSEYFNNPKEISLLNINVSVY
ncbi:hypothetical protein NECAME_03277 [Necator americanus]|uniref:Carboxylesterase type B domain-containing protein n=1 Tax=Necator americanus TaxID=51031 RepID=W2T851_NECAM|nr:hypothetical protein NECAME_03277 [Necator americanus]ETN77177.1 hypothetical protein NECAME_03277 [Necator americanus]